MKSSENKKHLLKKVGDESKSTNPIAEEDIQTVIPFEEDGNTFPGYPAYPPTDDIYYNDKVAENQNQETAPKVKKPGDKTGDDLDVPGAELDDEQEDIGSEDEENNYYSLGGDENSNLDEDKGE
jgi:hypothetical protein